MYLLHALRLFALVRPPDHHPVQPREAVEGLVIGAQVAVVEEGGVLRGHEDVAQLLQPDGGSRPTLTGDGHGVRGQGLLRRQGRGRDGLSLVGLLGVAGRRGCGRNDGSDDVTGTVGGHDSLAGSLGFKTTPRFGDLHTLIGKRET